LEVIGATNSAVLREEMNELYQKINNYVYEIQIIELDEYLYGMNRKRIDMEKAYDIISNNPNSESNAIMIFWNGCFADPGLSFLNRAELKRKKVEPTHFIGRQWIWILREWQKLVINMHKRVLV